MKSSIFQWFIFVFVHFFHSNGEYLKNVDRTFRGLLFTRAEYESQITKFYLKKLGNFSNLECLAESIESKSILDFLDASFKVPSGVLHGNLDNWFGSFDECLDIPTGQFCLVSVLPKRHLGSHVDLGVCVPNSCSQHEIYQFIEVYSDFLFNRSEFYMQSIRCHNNDVKYSPYFAVAITVIGLIFGLNIASTVYDIRKRIRDDDSDFKFAPLQPTPPPSRAPSPVNLMSHQRLPPNSLSPLDYPLSSSFYFIRRPFSRLNSKRSLLDEVAMSFSFIRNAERLLDTKDSSSIRHYLDRSKVDYCSVHGIKLLSLMWVILGHCYVLPTPYVDNMRNVFKFRKFFEFQIVNQSLLAVDSFLVLSGFLLGYTAIRQMDKLSLSLRAKSSTMSRKMYTLSWLRFWTTFYIHRYLRLTPLLVFVVLVYMGIMPYIFDGPLWIQQTDLNCVRNWWANILYTNNLVHSDEQCLGWTWYLAVDAQLFAISPLPLVLFFLGLTTGWICVVTYLAVSVVSNLLISYDKLITAAPSASAFSNYLTAFNASGDYFIEQQYSTNFFSDFYTLPWCRCGAWIVGMALGCTLNRAAPSFSSSRLQSEMTRKLISLFGWTLSIVFGVVIVYGLWPIYADYYVIPQWLSSLYWAGSRLIWAAIIAWLIYVCAAECYGYRPLGALLRFRGFIPFSRLVYCSYLIHPLVAACLILTSRTALQFSGSFFAFFYGGTLLLTFAASFLITVAVEMPFINLNKNTNSFSSAYQAFLTDAYTLHYFPNNAFVQLNSSRQPEREIVRDLAAFAIAHGNPISILYQQVFLQGEKDFTLSVKGISTDCEADLLKIVISLIGQRPEWALRFVDAFFKIPAGLLDGNINWFGAFDECWNLKVDTELFKTEGKYCLVPVDGLLKLGTCVPSSCQPSDLEAIVKMVNNFAHNNSIFNITSLNITANAEDILCISPTPHLTTYFYVAISVSVILVIINLLSTGYDLVGHVRSYYSTSSLQGRSVLDISASSSLYFGNNTHVTSGNINNLSNAVDTQNQQVAVVTDDEAPLVSDIDGPPNLNQDNTATADSSLVMQSTRLSRRDEFLLSFSLFRNIPKVLSTDHVKTKSQNTLQALHGLRLLSMWWLILSHAILFSLTTGIDNIFGFLDLFQNFEFQAIFHAFYAVDTFLILGGFLLGYLTLKQLDKLELSPGNRIGKIVKYFAKFYIHRYVRLTPCYALLVLVYLGIAPYFMYGPNWKQTPDPLCTNGQSWWKNLLYVQNLVDKDQMCMPWTWYLAVDFQLFLISPLPLLAFYWRPFAGWLVSIAIIAASSISSGLLAAEFDFEGAVFSNLVLNRSNLAFDINDFEKHFVGDYFLMPWTRAAPWAIGLALGCALHRMPPSFANSRLQSPAVRIVIGIFGWTISLCLGFILVYGMWPVYMGYYDLPAWVSQLYWAGSRVAWSLSICWVIYACVADIFPGNLVRRFLSWSPFVPLSRLTYCVFLFHPIIICTYLWSARLPIHLHDMEMCYLFLASVVFCFASVFPLAIGVEIPFSNLERLIFDRHSHRD